MQHIKIHTDFDITHTKVTRNYKQEKFPLKVNGVVINSKDEWIKYRRQQTNWETVTQVLLLRAQPFNIRTIRNKSDWTMEFDIEYMDAYRKNEDPLGLLKEDFENLPMITGLDERKKIGDFVIVSGKKANMRFEIDEL